MSGPNTLAIKSPVEALDFRKIWDQLCEIRSAIIPCQATVTYWSEIYSKPAKRSKIR